MRSGARRVMQVITGGPGTGKHSAARELARATGAPVIDLNSMARECGASVGGQVDVQILSAALADVSSDAIVVGHLAPYVVSPGCRAAVLRRDPRQLLQVYREREYPDTKAAENCAAEILGVTAHDALERFGRRNTVQINTTGRAPGEAARMAAEAAPPGDAVDWLAEAAGRGELPSFFPPVK